MNQDQQEQLVQLEAAVKSVMTKEAVERFNNIKVAHPQKAIQVMAFVAQLVQQGKTSRIDDTTLKAMLGQLEQKRQTKITFR